MYALELGGEDDAFAACEARSAATEVRVAGAGAATAASVRPERVRALAYTRAASRLVCRSAPTVPAARDALADAALDVSGTVAVRARDLRGATGVSTSDAERELGGVLVDRGYAVDLDDPDNELRVLFAADPGGDDSASESDSDESGDGDAAGAGAAGGVCLAGWLVAESVRDYGARRPTDRPFFQPGSMDPLDARALANIAGAAPGATLLDPMCGTGGVLIEAGLVGARVVGVDAQWKMVRGARENLRTYLGAGAAADVVRGDATALPLRDDAVDAVVFDAPYGRQSKIARHTLERLVSGALSEAVRVAPRAVLVADRDWREAATDAGWQGEALFERPVHRSLTRYVHVLERRA